MPPPPLQLMVSRWKRFSPRLLGSGEHSRTLAALIKDLGLLEKAPLKPQQKLWAVKSTDIPKHQYQRVIGKTTKGTLLRSDLEVSKFIKNVIHLPHNTPIAAFYTKVCDRGTGVPSFTRTSVVLALKRGITEMLSALADAPVARIAERFLQISGPFSKDLKKSATGMYKTKLYATVDGRGL